MIRVRPIAITLICGASLSSACTRRGGRSIDTLLDSLRTADPTHVLSLLDTETRWSIMSAYRSRRAARSHISRQYQGQRRLERLRRFDLAQAPTIAQFFGAYATRHHLLVSLRRKPENRAPLIDNTGLRAIAYVDGGKLDLCKEKSVGWTFCGFRTHFEKLKIRSARDFDTIRASEHH